MSESDGVAGSTSVPASVPALVSALVSTVLAALRKSDGAVTALGRVCRACVELLPVDGASVSVMLGTQHQQRLYASDPVIERIETLQFSLGEGPCYEALETGRPVLVPDLAQYTSSAWPVFAAQAAAHSVSGDQTEQIGAIFAFPLQRGAARLGVVDMYRHAPGWLSETELATALLLTDVATSALLAGSSTGPDGEIDDAWTRDLALDRAVVHQATGIVSAEFEIPVDQALSRLRGYAFSQGRLLEELATDLVAGRLHPRVIDG